MAESKPDVRDAEFECNSRVSSPFGDGCVLSYREVDRTFLVQLAYGKLYCVAETLKSVKRSAQELSAAYESLENMRKLNLQVQCNDLGVAYRDDDSCVMCILSSSTKDTTSFLSKLNRGRKIHKGTPCLVCASPTCSKHSSPAFRKEKITLCLQCHELTNFAESSDQTPTGADPFNWIIPSKIEHTLVVYDRALLLLRYSAQFALLQVAAQLESTQKTTNSVGLGTSSGRMVSGALGLAGAAAILTPAGVPLLTASLLFGGTSTAVQVGHGTANYFSEPQKVANRILALHGILVSILVEAHAMRLALLEDDVLLQNVHSSSAVSALESLNTGINATQYTNTGLKVGTAAGVQSAGAASKVIGTLRLAPLIGTVFSATKLALDAKTAKTTLQKIQAGNPCEKADMLRDVMRELDDLPTTETLETECQALLEVVSIRRHMQEKR